MCQLKFSDVVSPFLNARGYSWKVRIKMGTSDIAAINRDTNVNTRGLSTHSIHAGLCDSDQTRY